MQQQTMRGVRVEMAAGVVGDAQMRPHDDGGSR
jgi:hypothetical protein